VEEDGDDMNVGKFNKESTVALSNVSLRLNKMFADPKHDEYAFWTLTQDYIGKLLNRMVSQDDIEELTQDCLIQVFKSLDKVKIDPAHSGANSGYKCWKGNSSFTRWLSGLVSRRVANMRRDRAMAKEIPLSQLGTWDEANEWRPDAIEELSSEAVVQPHNPDEDELREKRWSRADRITAALDQVRELLDDTDRVIFDMFREGSTSYAIGKRIGMHESNVRRKLWQWNQMAKRAGLEVQLEDREAEADYSVAA
jgi:DNA-directed RNA polymerase specialized sigma24 family protein